MNWTISTSDKVSHAQVSHIIPNEKLNITCIICFKMWNCCLPPLFVLRGKKAVGFYILLAHIGDSDYITNWWGAVVLVVFSTFVQMCSKTTLIMSKNLWTTCFVFVLCLSGRAHTAQRERKEEKAQFVFSGWAFLLLFLFLFEPFATPFANGFHFELTCRHHFQP